MKTHFRPAKNHGAALLFTCLGAAVVVIIALGSYLILVESEAASIARSQAWNNSLVIAEAGVEEGMAMINKYAGTSHTLTDWPTTANADGWNQQSGNVYYLTRSIGAGAYTVYVTNVSPTVAAIFSTGTDNWTNLSITSIRRAVLVNADTSTAFQGAILAKEGITLSGSAMVDSFNSANTNYSRNGLYDPRKHEAGGNIMIDASNSVGTTEFTMSGGTHVYGHVFTGPDDVITQSGGATIGDTNYFPAGNGGIEPGWTSTTANISIPDAPPVPTGVSWLSMPKKVKKTYILSGFGPGTTTYYVIPSGFGNLSGDQSILITNGTIVLDVQGNFEMSGSSAINLAPDASLEAWFDGNPTISGSGVVNESGNATNVAFYGTTNCTKLTYSGSASFIGTIYAPEAHVDWSGSAEVIGAVVANSFNDSGGASIHYDEALQRQASGSYTLYSWQEVPPP